MLKSILMCLLAFIAISGSARAQDPEVTNQNHPIAIVIHGGAGGLDPDDFGNDERRAAEADLNAALDAGYEVLKRGGSALDAVEATIQVMEDLPRFNAGKGSVFNAVGQHELDASIMEGHTRRAGAVAGVKTVRNPILLARAVMERTPHVMLAGVGAEAFADTLPDIQRVPNDWFDTPYRLEEQRQIQKKQAALIDAGEGWFVKPRYLGTVGAVALDRYGRLAAATSTGGMSNKRWGRVGDSPIIGAGTWADDQCGVSATGWGEFYIRTNAAREICVRRRYLGISIAKAADEVINQEIPSMGGEGGAVALDVDGNISTPFNTEGMYRAWITKDGRRSVAIFQGEGNEGVKESLAQDR